MKLELLDLEFGYTSPIFKKLSLKIDGSSFISVLGENNSGKTTLLKILNGEIKSNNLTLNDTKPTKRLLNDIVYYVDKECLFFSKTVYDELMLYTSDEYKIKKALQTFKMKKSINKSPNSLPDDEKIILKIIIGYLKDPKILLMDNIFSCFSIQKKYFVLKIIKKYCSKNKIGVVLTTNNLYDSIYSDELYIINNGKLTSNFEKSNISLPFSYELSEKLRLYDLIDEDEFNLEKLAEKLC